MSEPQDNASARMRGAIALLAMGVAASEIEDLSYTGLKRSFRELLLRDPMDSLMVLVLGGAYLFYLAESEQNPKCASYADALVFISTCLSVGYADVFARTEAGKMIATFVMTIGPALSGAALEKPEREPDEALELNRAILGRLDAILEALRSGS